MATTTTDRLNGINSGVAIKAPCRVATTAAITLSGEQTIDDIALVAGDRVLVKNQASSVDNGIYEVSTSSWQRTPDFDGSNDVVTGTTVYVNFGTTNANTAFQVTTTGTILPGTSAITWIQSSNLSNILSYLAPFVDSTAIIKGSADATKLLKIEVDGFTTGTTRTLTAPNYDGTIATSAGTETLTNKSLQDSTTFIVGSSDATKKVKFEVDGLTTSTTRTLTIRDTDATLVGEAITQTLTNKTITDAIDSGYVSNSAQFDKTSDTGIAAVTGLSISLSANAVYVFGADIYGTSGASGGVKFALDTPAAPTSFRATCWNYNGTTLNAVSTTTTAGATIGAATAVFTNATIGGVIRTGAASGTLRVFMAQNASNGTTTSVYANSSLWAKRVS